MLTLARSGLRWGNFSSGIATRQESLCTEGVGAGRSRKSPLPFTTTSSPAWVWYDQEYHPSTTASSAVLRLMVIAWLGALIFPVSVAVSSPLAASMVTSLIVGPGQVAEACPANRCQKVASLVIQIPAVVKISELRIAPTSRSRRLRRRFGVAFAADMAADSGAGRVGPSTAGA